MCSNWNLTTIVQCSAEQVLWIKSQKTVGGWTVFALFYEAYKVILVAYRPAGDRQLRIVLLELYMYTVYLFKNHITIKCRAYLVINISKTSR